MVHTHVIKKCMLITSNGLFWYNCIDFYVIKMNHHEFRLAKSHLSSVRFSHNVSDADSSPAGG